MDKIGTNELLSVRQLSRRFEEKILILDIPGVKRRPLLSDAISVTKCP